MIAYETSINISDTGGIEIPAGILEKIPRNKKIKAILLVPDPVNYEDQDWDALTVKEFLSGYHRSDEVYDKL